MIGDDKPIKIRNLTVTKEFVLFMLGFGVLITILLYNPAENRKILDEIVNVGLQLNDTVHQGVNNTELIINNSNTRFNITGERNEVLVSKLVELINATEQSNKQSGSDIIKVLFLYLQDVERDINKIMLKENITNLHFVKVNDTHVMTENGTFKLPYPINMTIKGAITPPVNGSLFN